MALVAASTVASDDGGIHLITIPIPSGRSGGTSTGGCNYKGGTVMDAYISTFSEVSSESNFN